MWSKGVADLTRGTKIGDLIMLTTESALRKDRTNARGPSLEHRHFAVIAGIIRELEPATNQGQWLTFANGFADKLTATNPRFDRARFLTACGVES